jgi:hypothetical protein
MKIKKIKSQLTFIIYLLIFSNSCTLTEIKCIFCHQVQVRINYFFNLECKKKTSLQKNQLIMVNFIPFGDKSSNQSQI